MKRGEASRSNAEKDEDAYGADFRSLNVSVHVEREMEKPRDTRKSKWDVYHDEEDEEEVSLCCVLSLSRTMQIINVTCEQDEYPFDSEYTTIVPPRAAMAPKGTRLERGGEGKTPAGVIRTGSTKWSKYL
jgi:hypothetical protein